MFLMSSPATTSLTCPVEASSSPRTGGGGNGDHPPAWPSWPRPPLTPPYQAQTGTCSFLSRRDLSSGFSSRCSRPHSGGSSQAAPGGCHPGTCRRQVSGWALAPGWGYKHSTRTNTSGPFIPLPLGLVREGATASAPRIPTSSPASGDRDPYLASLGLPPRDYTGT